MTAKPRTKNAFTKVLSVQFSRVIMCVLNIQMNTSARCSVLFFVSSGVTPAVFHCGVRPTTQEGNNKVNGAETQKTASLRTDKNNNSSSGFLLITLLLMTTTLLPASCSIKRTDVQRKQGKIRIYNIYISRVPTRTVSVPGFFFFAPPTH